MDVQLDTQFANMPSDSGALSKRQTSRLWYRQAASGQRDLAPLSATYIARSTSQLSPEVVDRHEQEEALRLLFA